MAEPLTRYQRRLFVFLSVACFFEGYDFFALSQLLPNLRHALHLSESQAGLMLTVVNLGTVVAYLLVRMGDQWGRKKLMTVTIIGYTLTTFLTGFATSAVFFALAQFLARVFLIAEWAISMVYAAEEFPAERRGMVIGVIQAASSLGGIVCAGVVPLLLKTPYGWRVVYWSALIPLALIAYLRRDLRETQKFLDRRAVGEISQSLLRIWSTPSKTWVLRVSVLWILTYIGTSSAVLYWKEFAVHERGFTDAEVSKAITIAALGSMPLAFGAGKLIDLFGRRRGGALIYAVAALGIFGAYTLHSPATLTVALTLGIFGATAVLPVMNAITAELFPTELRADAYAWCNNLLGRIGYVFTPLVIGAAAERLKAHGPVLAVTPVVLVAAVLWMFVMVPETRGRDVDNEGFSQAQP